MKTQDDDVSIKMRPGSSLATFAWLIAGVGIGAIAGNTFGSSARRKHAGMDFDQV